MSSRLRRLLWPGVMATVMLAVLLGLGTWQVARLHWKQGVLAQVARAEAGPAMPLPAEPEPYTKVQVTGHLRDDLSASYGAEVRDTPAGTQLGAYLIEPLERDDGDAILVNRGWVPDKRPRPIARPEGDVMLEGYVRPSDTPGLFSATDNPAARQFYTLDASAIGGALGLRQVAPFILVAMGPAPPERYPDPARHLPRPPNNHLSYAITWYGLAIALVVIFVLWARKVLNE
ncbi:MAG TPA: SURF1 family protein [Acetobacteraceae bacterium]|nr:SURF1 family protein [Acetobacteraceae bacterium]